METAVLVVTQVTTRNSVRAYGVTRVTALRLALPPL